MEPIEFEELMLSTQKFGTKINVASSAAPQIPLVLEDAEIEPRTVASFALVVSQTRPEHCQLVF